MAKTTSPTQNNCVSKCLRHYRIFLIGSNHVSYNFYYKMFAKKSALKMIVPSTTRQDKITKMAMPNTVK